MKPMSGCALYGANKVFLGIQDAVILQHSVIGCNWGTMALHHLQKPYNIRQASTVVYEENVIGGGDGLVTKALKNIEELYPQARAVFILSGCVPNMIGDDVEGVLSGVETKKTLLHVAVPGYARTFDQGVEQAFTTLGHFLRPGKRTKEPSINIIGLCSDDPYVDNDLRVLQELLWNQVRLICSTSRCTTEEISAMPQASLSIIFGYGEGLAQQLEQDYGVPYAKLDYPYGIQGTLSFLERLEELLDVDFSAKKQRVEEEGQQIVRKAAGFLTSLYYMPVALIGDKAHFGGMERFLEDEVGLNIVVSALNNEGDLDQVEAAIKKNGPTLIFGSSYDQYFAEKFQLPLIRYNYPFLDELCLTRDSLLGVEGTGRLLEKIINGALQLPYKREGNYASLRGCGDPR